MPGVPWKICLGSKCPKQAAPRRKHNRICEHLQLQHQPICHSAIDINTQWLQLRIFNKPRKQSPGVKVQECACIWMLASGGLPGHVSLGRGDQIAHFTSTSCSSLFSLPKEICPAIHICNSGDFQFTQTLVLWCCMHVRFLCAVLQYGVRSNWNVQTNDGDQFFFFFFFLVPGRAKAATQIVLRFEERVCRNANSRARCRCALPAHARARVSFLFFSFSLAQFAITVSSFLCFRSLLPHGQEKKS